MRHERRRFGRRRRRRIGVSWLLVMLLVGALLLLAGLYPERVLQAEFARQRWFAGAAERTLEVDGRRWQYLEAGSGPPLLLLHGFTGSKENWLPVIGALAEDFHVIAPDLPGWGYGAALPPPPPYGYRADAARLEMFAEALWPGRRFDLVGHSMGGGVAAVLAGDSPSKVQRLVLMDAAGVEYDNEFARAVQAGGHPFGVDDGTDLERYMQLVFVDPPWVPWPVDRALIEHRIANAPFEREVLQAISAPPTALAPEQAAPAITAPTLLLWCRNDRVVDLSAAERYRELIPHSELLLLDGCNHMPMMELPAATVQALRGFLLPTVR